MNCKNSLKPLPPASLLLSMGSYLHFSLVQLSHDSITVPFLGLWIPSIDHWLCKKQCPVKFCLTGKVHTFYLTYRIMTKWLLENSLEWIQTQNDRLNTHGNEKPISMGNCSNITHLLFVFGNQQPWQADKRAFGVYYFLWVFLPST